LARDRHQDNGTDRAIMPPLQLSLRRHKKLSYSYDEPSVSGKISTSIYLQTTESSNKMRPQLGQISA